MTSRRGMFIARVTASPSDRVIDSYSNQAISVAVCPDRPLCPRFSWIRYGGCSSVGRARKTSLSNPSLHVRVRARRERLTHPRSGSQVRALPSSPLRAQSPWLTGTLPWRDPLPEAILTNTKTMTVTKMSEVDAGRYEAERERDLLMNAAEELLSAYSGSRAPTMMRLRETVNEVKASIAERRNAG